MLDASVGGTIAANAATNNYLKHADVDKLAAQLAKCTPTDSACRASVMANAKIISDKNDAELLACKNDQTCVQNNIAQIVDGMKAFNELFAADKSSDKAVAGYSTDLQTKGALIAANLSATNEGFDTWKIGNCGGLDNASCTQRFNAAIGLGNVISPKGALDIVRTSNLGSGPHQYTNNTISCSTILGGDCSVSQTATDLRTYAGPGMDGSHAIKSGDVSQIRLSDINLGYVTHLVDPSTNSVVNITVPGQHALDPGWVVRNVDQVSNGSTYINSYGAGTGALAYINSLDPVVSTTWSGNVILNTFKLPFPSWVPWNTGIPKSPPISAGK